MTTDGLAPPDPDDRLNEVVLAYLEAAQAGWAPLAREVLAAYPDLRPGLDEFFAGRAELERLAAPIRGAVRDGSGLGLDASAVPPLPGTAAGGGPALGILGDFRLVREVGRGGMGVVYEAEQLSLRRRVALKVLPFAAAVDPRRLQRFRNEAMAAANLRHDGIVPVYAVGSERGVHYYAMQFVDGQSLAALAAGVREPAAGAETVGQIVTSLTRDRAAGRGRYARWAADLARQAAAALDHAHRAGVVHRDVKPANLLLDPLGHLWVADFGLAQVSADPGVTVTGEVLGTLRYASPEQALGRPGADHRADVYSLGATLYELLTLRPPFDAADRHALLRQIAEADPVAPRALDRSIPVELETIVLKALAKDPADRYATAGELADDLRRFLDDRPIRARRPSAWEKLAKWGRRHRAVVAAAGAGLVLAVAGLGVATALTARAYDRERAARETAEASFRQARGAVDRFARIAEEDLADRPDLDGARRRMLDAALAYYQDFLDQRRDDPAAQAELEQARDRVKAILADLAVLQGVVRHVLLGDPRVQDDLRLTADQRARVDDLFRRWADRPEGSDEVRRLAPADRSRRLIDEIKAHEAAVAGVLDPAQRRRLGQLALQVRGPRALRDTEVAAALGLTADQQARIRAATAGPPHGPPGPWGGPGFEAAVAVLTPGQQVRWRELTGEPFPGPLPLLPVLRPAARTQAVVEPREPVPGRHGLFPTPLVKTA